MIFLGGEGGGLGSHRRFLIGPSSKNNNHTIDTPKTRYT